MIKESDVTIAEMLDSMREMLDALTSLTLPGQADREIANARALLAMINRKKIA